MSVMYNYNYNAVPNYDCSGDSGNYAFRDNGHMGCDTYEPEQGVTIG